MHRGKLRWDFALASDNCATDVDGAFPRNVRGTCDRGERAKMETTGLAKVIWTVEYFHNMSRLLNFYHLLRPLGISP
jgi:hypothetical protein